MILFPECHSPIHILGPGGFSKNNNYEKKVMVCISTQKLAAKDCTVRVMRSEVLYTQPRGKENNNKNTLLLQRNRLGFTKKWTWTFFGDSTILGKKSWNSGKAKLCFVVHIIWKCSLVTWSMPNDGLMCMVSRLWYFPNLGPSLIRTVLILLPSLKFHLLQNWGLGCFSLTFYSNATLLSLYGENWHVLNIDK